MALATIDDLRLARAGAFQPLVFQKGSISSASADTLYSYWKSSGTPGAGTTPTTAAICDKSTTGALPLKNATIGTLRLYSASLYSSQDRVTFYLFDRLAHMGGLSGTNTGSQTVNLAVTDGSLATRIGASDYSDVRWFLECYTGLGSTSVSATVTYTNGAGTSGRTTTVTITTSMVVGETVEIIGTDNEPIRSIESIQHATTGTAGNYGVTAVRNIDIFPTTEKDVVADFKYAETLLAKIFNDSCLFFGVMPQTSTAGSLNGGLILIDR